MTIPQRNLFSQKCQRLTEIHAACAFQCHNHFCFQPLIFIQYATYHMCNDIMYSSPSPFDCFLLWAGRVAQLKVFNGQFIGRLTSAHWHTPALHSPVGADAVCWKQNWSEKTHSTAPAEVLIGEIQLQDWGEQVSGPIIRFRNHVTKPIAQMSLINDLFTRHWLYAQMWDTADQLQVIVLRSDRPQSTFIFFAFYVM